MVGFFSLVAETLFCLTVNDSLFVFPVTCSSFLSCIHLQRLILCLICVVRRTTTEILNIVRSAEQLLTEEEER